eukprot:3906418-Pyramimonas_sp.AAC.1
MVNLRNTAFNWECNSAPHVKVPDTLQLDFMTRWTRIVGYFSTFEADPANVNVQEKRFQDDPTVFGSFTSPLGKYMYLHDELFTFLHEYGIDKVRGYLSQPSENQLKRVKCFVADMVGAAAPWGDPEAAFSNSSSTLLLR